MPALQSFSLPRSGSRITASPCPPVVLRQRRRDYEAFFRSEIRCDDGSWPNRIARCSPGLPLLEPHRHATPTTRPQADEDVGRQGPVQARAELVADSAAPMPPPPEGDGHTGHAGEEDRVGITAAPRFRGIRPSAPPPKWRPRRSVPHATTDVVTSQPRGAPRDHRKPASTTRPRARAPQQHPRCPRSFRRMMSIAEALDPSAQPRSVRSAAAVDRVHVADGLIRSRSVTRGRVIRAKTPASARRREVPPNVGPLGSARSLAGRIAATRCRPGRQG
jgi:hypothetical protein